MPECPLCTIPLHEPLLYEDNDFYMIPTKDNKGHKVRIMIATKKHQAIITSEEQVKAISILTNYMTKLMRDQEWYLVGSEHASIKDHWHRLACDFPIEGEEDPLFPTTSKIRFPLEDKKILIGIPTYNEEKTLQSIINTAQKYGDILVIDDGSTDKTKQIINDNLIFSIKHNKNQGYGASIRDAFIYAQKHNYDVLVTIDSDGQHDPAEIPNFLSAINSSDIVTGNRFLGDHNTPGYRKLGITAINKLNNSGDSQCGFRAYNKRAIQIITNRLFEKGMGASIEILRIAQSEKLTISEISCTVTYGSEKHSQNPLMHGFDVILAFAWWMVWEKPSKTLLPLGLAFMLGTMISGAQALNLYIQFHVVVLSWAIFALTLLLCTLIIFNTLIFVLVFKNRKVNE